MIDFTLFDGKCIDIDSEELASAPIKTNDATNPDANNGLITSIWGPPYWDGFHSTTFGYPIQPTPQQQNDYLTYFTYLGKVLPCIFCRNSYEQFITEPDTLLDINTMKSRETLTRWGLNIHNAVNNKLGVDYGETYEELCYKYNSYRAKCTKTDKGCLMPADAKAKAYQKADIIRAPIIDVKYSMILQDHANTLGFDNYIKYVEYYDNIRRNSKEWGTRDCIARKIMKYMRKNGISSLDSNGLPTKHEMMLISMKSTTLNKTILDEIYSKIINHDQIVK